MADIEEKIKKLIDQLTIEEKVSLLSGADGWQTQEIARLGIGSLKTTDGPAGARGALSVDGPTAAFLPAPVSQAATWSKSHLHSIGQLLCREAKTKASQVLLAPTICCARNPLGGRNFESYSEDPFLSGSLATHYIGGVQESGEVAATVKHFVANEQEFQRFTIDTRISELALREIYLRPFEMVIKSTNPPKCVMTAYNLVNGEHMDSNPIIKKILREEWGFKGLVMSDWGGTNSIMESIIAGCDLEMPGPPEKRGAQLLAALKNNPSVDLLHAIERSCFRVLMLLNELHLLDMSFEDAQKSRKGIETSSNNEKDQKLLREIAAEGIVLLRNEHNLLPLMPSKLKRKRIAFIGPNSLLGIPGGGGSATMNPQYQTQPFAAFKSVLAKMNIEAEVKYSPGAFIGKWLPLTSPSQWNASQKDQIKDKSMLQIDFFSMADFSSLIETQYRDSSYIDLFDSAPVAYYEDKNAHSLRISSRLTPITSGKHSFGLSSVGNARLLVDGYLLVDNYDWDEVGETFYSFGSIEKQASFQMEANKEYSIIVEASSRVISNAKADDPIHVFGVQPSVRVGFLEQLPNDMIADAVKLSNESDITIAVLGLNDEWESEDYDRQTMKLPGDQDALIEALLRQSKNLENILVVNQSASPVEMPWADSIGTMLQAWYGGQEAGNALADVLLGRVNPSGKLPITWPRKYQDLSFQQSTWSGINGIVKYDEELAVGYRWYLNTHIEPQWWLGYGLSYTKFETELVDVVSIASGWDVCVKVENIGQISGKDVVQCYVSKSNDLVKELKAFDKSSLLEPG